MCFCDFSREGIIVLHFRVKCLHWLLEFVVIKCLEKEQLLGDQISGHFRKQFLQRVLHSCTCSNWQRFQVLKCQFIVGRNRNLPFSCYSLKAQPLILTGTWWALKKMCIEWINTTLNVNSTLNKSSINSWFYIPSSLV